MRIKFLLLLIAFFAIQASGNPKTEPKEEKVVRLSYLEVKDDVIMFAASDVHHMILRKNKGFLWPATKIVLFKQGDKLYFDITAIDNSWNNMFRDDEKTYGYFVIGGRAFIVASKGDTTVEMEQYFTIDNTIEKNFGKADPKSKPTAKSPIWYYFHKGTMATVLNSVNMANLGR